MEILNYSFSENLLDQRYADEKEGFAYRALEWLATFKMDAVRNCTFNNNCEAPVRLHLIPYFKNKKISDITTSEIQKYFNQKRGELALETLKKHKSCLIAIFDIAIDDGLRERSPMTKRITVSSDIPQLKKNVWTLEQYQTVWQFARNHKYGLDIMTLMETAISRSELLGLTWSDYDSKRACFDLENGLTKAKNPHTGKLEFEYYGLKNRFRKRTIPLSKELNAYIYAKPHRINTSDGLVKTKHIFHAPKGGAHAPDNWYRRTYKGFMRDLKEKHPEIPLLTPHELRHTRATILVNYEKVDLFSVAELLGHKDLRMLRERYAHSNEECLRKALGF